VPGTTRRSALIQFSPEDLDSQLDVIMMFLMVCTCGNPHLSYNNPHIHAPSFKANMYVREQISGYLEVKRDWTNEEVDVSL